MSFINWGQESPEQLALRKKLEQDAIYEQAIRMAQIRQLTSQAVAGGGGDTLAGLYGIGVDGLIYNLNRSETNWPYNYLPFPDITQITLNKDNNFLYAVLDFDGTSYFIQIDKNTRDFTFIENDISDYAVKGASSLYYEGDNKFIYLDNWYKKAISSIIRIEVDQLLPGTATATVVSEVDSEETGYLLRNLFLYDGTPWAIAYLGSDIIIGPFDIDGGTFNYFNLLVPSPNETRVEQILVVFSTIEHKGVVYAAILFSDAELGGSGNLGLFKIDTETGGALAPYYITFIKDLFLEGHEGVPIVSLFSY